MSNLPPGRPGAPPAQPHCTCMSGITDAQLKLANLGGGLQVVEWLAVEAQQAVAAPSPIGDPALHSALVELQEVLARAQGLCLNHAFPQGAP